MKHDKIVFLDMSLITNHLYIKTIIVFMFHEFNIEPTPGKPKVIVRITINHNLQSGSIQYVTPMPIPPLDIVL